MDIKLNDNEQLFEVNSGISLIQRKDGLMYGTDAYLLAAFVRPKSRKYIADLGSGTGIIPLLCVSSGKARTAYAVEIQPEFADIIARNAALNRMEDRIIPVCSDVRALTITDQVEAVVTNPPYMKTGNGRRNGSDAKYIARHEVCGNVSDFCTAASKILRTHGEFFCVWRPDRLTDLICAMRDAEIEPKRIVTVYPDADSRPAFVLIEGRKSAAPGLLFMPPLIIYEDPGKQIYTDDMEYIYANCNFPDKFLPLNK